MANGNAAQYMEGPREEGVMAPMPVQGQVAAQLEPGAPQPGTF